MAAICRRPGTSLLSGSDESYHALTDWGQYDFYNFVATGVPGAYRWSPNTAGNVLLGGLSLSQAVPEPATWAMMLIGFGAIGFASRRRKSAALKLA